MILRIVGSALWVRHLDAPRHGVWNEGLKGEVEMRGKSEQVGSELEAQAYIHGDLYITRRPIKRNR